MKLENSRLIQVDPETVWESLVSVEVLKQCIPGCQSMEQTGDNEYALTMKSKVGPVSATFKGELRLKDIVPGKSYTLEFKGSGGAAGFSKGSAQVRLEPAEGGTTLYYTVDASIGGKIAQIGQRLVDGAAHKMANDFFSRFDEIVAPAAPAEDSDGDDAPANSTPAAAPASGSRSWVYVGAGAVVALVLLWLWLGR